MDTLSPAEKKLQSYFDQILAYVENTSKSEEDSILLAGAFMSAARVLYFNHMNPDDAHHIMEQNTVDFVDLIKPTIH